MYQVGIFLGDGRWPHIYGSCGPRGSGTRSAPCVSVETCLSQKWLGVLLAGSWDLVTNYNWAYNPTYAGQPNEQQGDKPSHK